ncbi:MAG: hypothetical protein R3D26_13120 [Cyanobacteriota/Melainabacteria group bacterium]
MKNSKSKVSLILISLLGSWFCLIGQTKAEEAAPNPVKRKNPEINRLGGGNVSGIL